VNENIFGKRFYWEDEISNHADFLCQHGIKFARRYIIIVNRGVRFPRFYQKVGFKESLKKFEKV
jgi:hypothetical protein